MPVGTKETKFDELIEDEYKHIEDKIVERTVLCTKKDIAILQSLLARNGASVTAPAYIMRPIFKIIRQITGTDESNS